VLKVTHGHVDAEIAVSPLHHLAMPFGQLIFGKALKLLLPEVRL